MLCLDLFACKRSLKPFNSNSCAAPRGLVTSTAVTVVRDDWDLTVRAFNPLSIERYTALS